MFTLDDLKETRYFQDVKLEGKLEGIQQEISLIIRLLKRKVSDLSPELELKVRNLPLEILEDLGEALLDFSSLEDLTSWLDNK